MRVPKTVKICRKGMSSQIKLVFKKSSFITSRVIETAEILIILS